MTRYSKRVPLYLLSSLMLTSPSLAANAAADLVLINGEVKTPSGWAEAIAVKDGIIVATGTTDEMKKLGAKKSIDLGGKTVLPGFHDTHVHPIYGGIDAMSCKIEQGSDLPTTLKVVKACVDKAGKGAWVTGGQWDSSALGQAPTRQMLDAISPDNPIYLFDTSLHSGWVNSKALEVAGITAETKDPEGGFLERDANGVPTGVLRESAKGLVQSHMPPPTQETLTKALKWSADLMLSYGITAFTEAALGFTAGEAEFMAYKTLADNGGLKQRTRVCVNWKTDNEDFEDVLRNTAFYEGGRVNIDCVKIFLDGVPTDGHTAAMLEPYADTDGSKGQPHDKGMLLIPQDKLNKAVTRFDAMGYTVKFHAAGDAAVHAGITAIAAARKANGMSTNLHDVGHCTFVDPDDMKNAREIGATFEVSPYLWTPSAINDDITKAVGPERIKRVWPVKELVESGSLVVPGSDWAVVPSVNPWPAVESLVTRELPGGSENSFGKAEAISVEQAIDLFTGNSARHMGRENRTGKLERGMLADLIVINQNPYKISAYDIHKTEVVMTFINGEKVYEQGKAKK